MRRSITLGLLLFPLVALAEENALETKAVKRVYNHLLIEDPYSALADAQSSLKNYPDSKALRLVMIRSLCALGNEVEALEEWNELVKVENELLSDRASLEMLAWGVLKKGGSSNQLVIRANALIGAMLTKDVKAIPLILDALKGSNSMLRALAVQMAAAYGDFPFQDEVARLFKEEKVWHVRLELIKAVGQLRMTEAKEHLLEIISHPRTLAEEKVAAIIALVNMYDSIEDRELACLIQSNRAGLRQLACQVISHLHLTDKAPFLLPLFSDSHSDVRMAALNTLALLEVHEIQGEPIMNIVPIARLMDDRVPEVAITASWLAFLQQDKRGAASLKRWIQKGDLKHARLAAGALAITGQQGAALSLKLLKKHTDPYVQVTLALGLIGQRVATDIACQTIDTHLKKKELWMWDTAGNPLFRSLAPSRVPHMAQVPNYPSVVDQITRLDLLQVLCIMEYPKALDAVKEFLQTHVWGAVGAAAAMLIQEGDDEALDVVRTLLNDPDEKVRIQAALILALLGGDTEAVKVLREVYPKVGKELKIQIIEAVARVGDAESIPFLLERLNEPFQVMRVVAATAIIQCLYH